MCDVRIQEGEGEGSKTLTYLLAFLTDPSTLALASLLGSRSMAMVQSEEQSTLENNGKEGPRRRGPLGKVKGGEKSLRREEGAVGHGQPAKQERRKREEIGARPPNPIKNLIISHDEISGVRSRVFYLFERGG